MQLGNNNDYPAGTIFNRITYSGAGYTASGNRMGLTGGIIVSHGAGNTSLYLPIDVGASQTFAVSLAGANLYLFGTVDLLGIRSILTFDGAGQTIVVSNISDSRVTFGGGTIHKNGTGTLYVLQHLTLDGPTVVNGGTLIMDGRMSNSAVTVNASATLRGAGKVSGLTVNSGGTVGPGLTSPATLDSLGDVALNAGSTLNIRLNGTSVGINYDQLRVQGTVTLGGTLNLTASFVPAVGEVFTIIENDGTDDTVGAFAGLPERAILMLNGRPFRISYGDRGAFGRDVNDVTLEAVPALSVWDGGGGQNKFWSTPQNWVGDTVPMPGDDIQFTNPISATMTTSNDFPAGRVVGAMSFAGDYHRLEGNQLAITRGIRMTQPAAVTLMVPLVLAASQTFWADLAGSSLSVDSIVDLAGHDLSPLTEADTRIGLDGVSGTGTVRKEGSGTSGVGVTPLTASLIVNNGTLGGGTLVGPVYVNTGAVFFASSVYDVEVRGGTVQGSISGMEVSGTLRMLEGSIYDVSIEFNQGPGTHITTFLILRGTGQVELAGGTLNLNVSPGVPRGSRYEIIWGYPGQNIVADTFNGLPDGSRFVANGSVITINYRPEGKVVLTVDAPFVWDGGGTGNLWTTASNWVGDLAPLPGKDLVFPANVSKLAAINDFAEGTIFSSVTFSGPSYVVAGNPFHTFRLTNDFASGETLIYQDLVVAGQPFSCMVGNSSRLRLEGRLIEDSVTFTRVLEKTGTGSLRFGGTGANDLTRVEVRQGELNWPSRLARTRFLAVWKSVTARTPHK